MSEMMHHNNFSAADIEKYRKGQLSPAEMHALEKAAMDDPFLADAMEGFGVGSQQPGVNSRENDIRELRERLRLRVEEKKSRTIPFGNWWKIAASVIVVAGGLWLFGVKNRSVSKNDIAAKEVVSTPVPSAVATDSVQPAPAEAGASANALQQSYRQDSVSTTLTAKRSQAASNKKQPTATLPSPAAQVATSPARPATDLVASGKAEADKARYESLEKKLNGRVPGLDIKQDTLKWAKSKAATYQNDASYDKDDKKEELLERRRQGIASNNTPFKDSVREYKVSARGYMNSPLNMFNGQVLDKLNKPVQGASIVIPGRQQTYVTDSLGNFAFKAPDTAVKVSVASVGFTQRYFTLRNSNNFGSNNGVTNNAPSFNNNSIAANNAGSYSNRIVLQQSNPALNEVVVVGYGARKKEVLNNRPDDTKLNPLEAEPVTGWDEFNDYLDRSKKIPDGADDIHGSVVVRFNVDSDGTLKNFAIEKSLNNALDAEAIRLVKEGPSWHLLKKKNKKTKVTVMVRF